MIRQKPYLLLEHLYQLKKSEDQFSACDSATLNWHLFQLVVLSKPDFNCLRSYASCFGKVTTGT